MQFGNYQNYGKCHRVSRNSSAVTKAKMACCIEMRIVKPFMATLSGSDSPGLYFLFQTVSGDSQAFPHGKPGSLL
ncbi:Uncharacterized protein dnm_049310 [Desulfonema magnum]|uniref:Uncharacterized protein n=1 Tax=Desulfonema magnum TaxID=45655 RepID=A0A975BPN9_9BACT|nr:Uncharacterized protein dnm_049310 [Desulfonema magnum]